MHTFNFKGTICVKDTFGNIWVPHEDAQLAIAESDEPEETALFICQYEPQRGDWG